MQVVRGVRFDHAHDPCMVGICAQVAPLGFFDLLDGVQIGEARDGAGFEPLRRQGFRDFSEDGILVFEVPIEAAVGNCCPLSQVRDSRVAVADCFEFAPRGVDEGAPCAAASGQLFG